MRTLSQRHKNWLRHIMPRLFTKESNQRLNERNKKAWQAKGNVTRLVTDS